MMANLQLLLWLFISSTRASAVSSLKKEPLLVGEVANVTVPEGRDVTLVCRVRHLGVHKVAWIHYDRSAILTVETNVITRNPRIGVTHDDQRIWKLHITRVNREDQGAYMCQINTAKAKTKLGYLSVVVPPRIDDSLGSGDTVRNEGSNVSLECVARGSPQPEITWKREDGRDINIDKANNISQSHVQGSVLRLLKVSRLDMGAYMCIASNGWPPAVSKRIQLGIDFPPMMWVPAQQVRVPVGDRAELRCVVEAHPEALTFWKKENKIVAAVNNLDDDEDESRRRVRLRTVRGEAPYKVEMWLIINKVEKDDFGNYQCVARNPSGITDGSIHLREEIVPTTMPPTTTTLSTTPMRTSFTPFKSTAVWFRVDQTADDRLWNAAEGEQPPYYGIDLGHNNEGGRSDKRRDDLFSSSSAPILVLTTLQLPIALFMIIDV